MNLKDPKVLTEEYLRIMQKFLDVGAPKELASLQASITLSKEFSGKKKLEIFDIDYYSRIITAIVDGVLFLKN